MEFGDEEPNIDFRHIDTPRFREGSFHSCPELLAPLTSNVVRYHNSFDCSPSQTREEEEIHIDVSRVRVSNHIYLIVLIFIYFSANCKSPILLGRFMLWRAQSTVPTPVTASPGIPLASALFTALWETHVLRYCDVSS
jgi:hypothetical protein